MSAAIALRDGDDLRASRTNLALSVRALARLSGVSPRTIRRIEEGSRPATRATLCKLEAALQANDIAIAAAAMGIQPGTRDELFHVVPWECDPVAQALVRAFPGGMTREQIAEFTGLDPRTIARIEQEALEALRNNGADLEAFLEPEVELSIAVPLRAGRGCGVESCDANDRHVEPID